MNGWLNSELVWVVCANIGKAFQTHSRRSSSGSNLLLFIGVAIGIVALLAGLYFWDRRKSNSKVETDTELILFRRLCKLHNLTAAETSLLERLATSRNLARRSDVFVNPDILSTRGGAGELAKKYTAIYKKLFGEPASVIP